MLGVAPLGRVAQPEGLIERVVVQPALEDLAERRHRRARVAGQVVGEVELELVADDAALAQQVVEAGHDHVDELGALRLHRVERLAHELAHLVVFGRGAKERPQHADARALERGAGREPSRYERRHVRRARSAVIASAGSGPTVASSMIARSVTVRASGPATSCVSESGITPVRLDRPRVARRPTRFWLAAGMRIDPHVSLPMPAAAKLAATAAPVPPLEPPGTRAQVVGIARLAR